MSTAAAGRAEARSRHPSARSPVPTELLAARLFDALARAGARFPDVAAAVLADRGVVGASTAEYARSLGVDPAAVERAEAGELAPAELPGPLRRVLAASAAGVR